MHTERFERNSKALGSVTVFLFVCHTTAVSYGKRVIALR